MRRSRAHYDGNTVSLFPFLAVLLCTMGALLVILVVISQQARANASRKNRQEQLPNQEEQIRAEDLAWQIKQFNRAREQTSKDLKNDRLKLGHLEDHLRRLRDQLEQLRIAASALEQKEGQTEADRFSEESESERLKKRIADATASLDEARRLAKNRNKSYSIIPYEGPNRTRRRPIYIECRADSVILQPEGIVLSREDFEEPLGPSNPLAAALRATREYYQHPELAPGDDPYPLLLIRPHGILAYYKVRDAIESWGPDFGYELIGEDWKLDFPPVNDHLAAVQSEAVERGRLYQQRLIRSAPSRYAKSASRYRARPHSGGFVREGGYPSRGGREGTGSESGRFGSGSGSGPNSDRAFSGGPSPNTGNQQPSGETNQGAATASQQDGSGSRGSASGSGSPGSSGATAGSGDAGGQSAGGSGSGTCSLAGARGHDWALPGASPNSTPITRPIRIAIHPTWLGIIRKDGSLVGRPVMMENSTEHAVDQFVSSIWDHMKSWGIAGSGLHWKPVLILDIDPRAVVRAKELEILLQNSGLEIRARETTNR